MAGLWWLPATALAAQAEPIFETPALLQVVHALTEDDLPRVQARADTGDAHAQVLLGLVHEIGIAGVKPQPMEALGWFLKAAAQGVAWAESWAADFYFVGSSGIDRDAARALELYRSAGRRGDARAAFAAGQMYFHGDGVAVDHREAASWFRRAAPADPELVNRMVAVADVRCDTDFCLSLRRILGAMMTGWADRFAAEWSETAHEWSSDVVLPGSELCGFTSSDRTSTGEIRSYFCDSPRVGDEAEGVALARRIADEVERALPAGFARTERDTRRPGPSTLFASEGYPPIRVTYNVTPGAAQHRVTLLVGR